MTSAFHVTEDFHALHNATRPLVLPNAWDYASAAALADAGYPAIGTTSLGVAAAYGLPDAAGAARTETLALAHRLGRLPCLLTVDIEGGFSADPAEVAGLATELAAAGAVGLNIEDGRPGDTLADPERQAELIAAVRQAVPGMYLNARIDTYWLGVGDPRLAVTVARAQRYLQAGADGVFVPGVAEVGDLRALVGLGAPLNVLYQPGWLGVAALAELGVRRISTGSLLFRAALGAIVDVADAVRDGRPIHTPAPSYADVQRLVTDPGERHVI